MTNLIVDCKVLKDVEMFWDKGNSIVILKLPRKYITREFDLLQRFKLTYNTFIDKYLLNYHNTYHYGDLTFERCLPLEINVNKNKAELIMCYDNNKDSGYFNRFKLEFGKKYNLIKQTDER